VLDGGLRFEVRFLETPHTLVLTCDPASGGSAAHSRGRSPDDGATAYDRLAPPSRIAAPPEPG
jgi:hypothetical protein